MQVRLPVFQEDDPLYIRSFGLELDGMKARFGPGRRDVGIIHYVLSGRGVFNGQPVGENQGFYIAPHSFCEYNPDPECPWNYFWMDCSPEFALRYGCVTVMPDTNGIFHYDFCRKLHPVIDKIMTGTHTMSSVEALGYAFSIMSMHMPRESVSRRSQYVRQAKSFIESSIGRNITVCDVADAVNIHDRYLYNLFVLEIGISPKEYILRRKLDTAEDLLVHTDLPVSEIAQAAGFPDLYGFSRLFKRKRGISPSEFRKALKNQVPAVDRIAK